MKKNNTRPVKLEQASSPSFENSMGPYNSTWVTDYAWVSGLTGAVAAIAIAAWYRVDGILHKGLTLFGTQLTSSRMQSLLAALLMITLCMVVVEGFRLWLRNRKHYFSLHPKIKSGHYFSFIFECFVNYLLYIVLLWAVIGIYHTVNEYGYRQNSTYYQIWFMFIDWVWNTYLIAGFPYALLTRGLKYDAENDVRDYGQYCARILVWPISKISKDIDAKYLMTSADKKITLGLFVKMFFTPLMTVFFVDHFPHLINNLGYVFGDLFGHQGLWTAVFSGNYSNRQLNNDLYNISISFLFTIDVALAWCGYVVSSRWVDNQTVSAEPTILGWAVCLLCYPPLQVAPGWLYSAPGEKQAIYTYDTQWIVTFFLILTLISFAVYMASTLWFGTRFSNLTHRGIIRKGPFSIIRHPAYASKNFAWWCIIFPAIVFNSFHQNFTHALTQCLGLALMTYIYYWRAITEERHLSADPAYVEYCKHVKYRFIPGVY